VAAPYDLTADNAAFLAAIRARIFGALKAWARGDADAMLAALDPPPAGQTDAASAADARAAFDAFVVEHAGLRLDPEARNARHTHMDRREAPARWHVQQVLVDANDLNDWIAEFVVNLAASRATQQPVLWLQRIGPLG
jgi:hypothetical protein